MGGTATFDFSGTGAGLPATFTRDTAVANPTTNAPFAFTGPQFGTKDVQETPEPGWTLTNIVCTANGAGHHHRHRQRRWLRQRRQRRLRPGRHHRPGVIVGAGMPRPARITNTKLVELIIEKIVINDDGGTATVDDFGITTDAGALVFGAAVEAPGRHVHLHRRRPSRSRPARTPSPSSRWPATTPTDWTCTNGDGGAFDAGTRHRSPPATTR